MLTCADLANLTEIVTAANRGVDRALEMLDLSVEVRDFEGIKFWSDSLKYWLETVASVKPQL